MLGNKHVQFMEWVEHGYGIAHIALGPCTCPGVGPLICSSDLQEVQIHLKQV